MDVYLHEDTNHVNAAFETGGGRPMWSLLVTLRPRRHVGDHCVSCLVQGKA